MRRKTIAALAEGGTILHLTGMQSTKYGGLERYFIELVGQCAARGYESVFVYDDLPQSRAFLDDLAALGATVVVRKLGVDPLPIARLIARYRPRVVNTHFSNKAVVVWVALFARMLGAKRLVHIEHSMPSASTLSKFRRFAYNRYDRVLCVSNAIADFLIKAGVKRGIVSTLYLGTSSRVQRLPGARERIRADFLIPEAAPVFGCIAFDTEFKGLDVLLKAVAALSPEIVNLHAIIVGVDPKVSKLPILADQLGIGDRVHWPGIRDEGWELLNAADFYVQPSRFAEGLSLATIEAMALSLPVVATRVAGPGEIVLHDKTGFLCAPDDVESLAGGLRDMLRAPERWDDFGRAGTDRYSEFFRSDKSVATLIDAYQLA
jgi:glycosyltransferase involved in cell wall biosynthesis